MRSFPRKLALGLTLAVSATGCYSTGTISLRAFEHASPKGNVRLDDRDIVNVSDVTEIEPVRPVDGQPSYADLPVHGPMHLFRAGGTVTLMGEDGRAVIDAPSYRVRVYDRDRTKSAVVAASVIGSVAALGAAMGVVTLVIGSSSRSFSIGPRFGGSFD